MEHAAPGLEECFSELERASVASVQESGRKILLSQMLVGLLEALPDYAFVLNQQRQIVAANSLVLRTFSGDDINQLLGKRPGEAVACVFASEGPDGCGTGEHCTTCGAARSIAESICSGSQASHECRLTMTAGAPISLDLRVISSPVSVEGLPLTLCIMRDISSEKRRYVLERVFFHDVINTAGGIHGIASLLAGSAEMEADRVEEYKQWMITLTETLIDEINHHRKLLAAERGDFQPVLGLVIVHDLLRDIHALYSYHDIASGRTLALGEIAECTVISDSAILRRIIGNLVKNALEATAVGGMVTLSCREVEGGVQFLVHNPGVIPREVQLQLFQRSFSTKEQQGRGIGTYSIKLFGERYLGGKVGFTSTEADGTTFTFTIPRYTGS